MTGPSYHMALADEAARTGRWTARRKAAVLKMIGRREITSAEAMRQFGISKEELDGWATRQLHHGEDGLKATKIQELR